ncbi:hypothetical protein [Actinomadura monticuli]|uniref:Uncharacterized protein n=1 Tax=Actinomadura monticuli TaxID=3097367 RepID=A0ABV4QMU7_9ACTN
MAGDAVRAWAVSVRLRRVAAGRAVQRLLVLGGLLIAGWLLGCAAQSAHADEIPPPMAVVAKTPVLGETVTAVHERGEPVRRVVRSVVEKAPRQVAQQVSTPVWDAPAAHRPAAVSETAEAPAPEARKQPNGGAVPGVSKIPRTRPSLGQGARHAVRHPSPPAPERHGEHSAAGGLVANGAVAGFPTALTWAPASPCASIARACGALPPAVRTAADERSFAPD